MVAAAIRTVFLDLGPARFRHNFAAFLIHGAVALRPLSGRLSELQSRTNGDKLLYEHIT